MIRLNKARRSRWRPAVSDLGDGADDNFLNSHWRRARRAERVSVQLRLEQPVSASISGIGHSDNQVVQFNAFAGSVATFGR